MTITTAITTAIAITAALEAVVIIILSNIIKLCVKENVKLVRGIAMSKNPEVFTEIYNDVARPHKKHVSLANRQNESM